MRIGAFSKVMAEHGFEGALVSPGSNFYYLTGLEIHETGERLTLLIVNTDGDFHLLAPALYKNVVGNLPVTLWNDGEDPYSKLSRAAVELGIKGGRILVEDTMRADWLIRLMKAMDITPHPLSTVMKTLRMRKGPEELRLMGKAAKVADDVFEEILSWDLTGLTERQLALKIELAIRERSDGISFEPIVASGKNGANPHHKPGERRLRKGDTVILDYGARWEGYCSDITRTVALGEPDPKLVEIYGVVKGAQENAFLAVGEGIKAGELDRVARETIENAGYGEYFIHRTGHGIGLDVHEEPYIAPGNSTILRGGMTFTIEPGIYIPGLGGVRIEDDVVVDRRGRMLTEASRELIQL